MAKERVESESSAANAANAANAQSAIAAGDRRFRPRALPSLLALVALAILISLGTWQANRYRETTAARAHYHEQHDVLAPVATLAVADAKDDHDRLARLHFRRAALRGVLEPARTQLLTARYVFSERGYGITMPLRLRDGAGPHARVLVDLGWVPVTHLADWLAKLGPAPERTIEGRLQVASVHDATQPPAGEHLGRPTWRSSNPAALAATIPDLEPRLMLVAGAQAVGREVDPTKYPIDGYSHPIRMLPSKHVEYAATWYGLALTLVAVWIAFSWRRRADATDRTA